MRLWNVPISQQCCRLAGKYSEFLEAFDYATAVWAGSAVCGGVLRRYGMEYMGFQNIRDDVRRRRRLRLAGRTNDRHFREAVEAIAARQASCDIEFQEAPEFSCWSVTTLRS